MTTASQLVQKLKNYRNVLRDDGLSHTAYVEQLTFLLFLKMDYEQAQLADQGITDYQSQIPDEYNWASLERLAGTDLETHYRKVLQELGKGTGLIPTIFRKARNQVQDPAKLERLINLIGEETWTGMTTDLKGDVYEELLSDYGQDIKSGAGQYFTPRPLIQACVDAIVPTPEDTIHDPAAGTGGFLLAAYKYITNEEIYKLNRDQRDKVRKNAITGVEIVDQTARMCVMNLYLHGIGTDLIDSPIQVQDSIANDPGTRYSLVLANPPFGKKSSYTIGNGSNGNSKESSVPVRQGFFETSNKQLNFVQHIFEILQIDGRAAVVVPDNVLFEGGTGEKVRRRLLKQADVHTLLRLPTGIFYKQGVKANVLFFDKRTDTGDYNTRELWIYDLRTNMHFTLKQNPLQNSDFDEFIECYNPRNRFDREETWSEENPDGRWRRYTLEDLLARDKLSMDIFWLRDESLEDSANLPAPEILAQEIMDDLQAALETFAEISAELGEE